MIPDRVSLSTLGGTTRGGWCACISAWICLAGWPRRCWALFKCRALFIAERARSKTIRSRVVTPRIVGARSGRGIITLTLIGVRPILIAVAITTVTARLLRTSDGLLQSRKHFCCLRSLRRECTSKVLRLFLKSIGHGRGSCCSRCCTWWHFFVFGLETKVCCHFNDLLMGEAINVHTVKLSRLNYLSGSFLIP